MLNFEEQSLEIEKNNFAMQKLTSSPYILLLQQCSPNSKRYWCRTYFLMQTWFCGTLTGSGTQANMRKGIRSRWKFWKRFRNGFLSYVWTGNRKTPWYYWEGGQLSYSEIPTTHYLIMDLVKMASLLVVRISKK